MTKTIALREIAHARSGEKGNDSNITVVAYDPADYAILRDQVTVAAVQELFGPITKGAIARYEAEGIGALNFVLRDVLEGGRSRTLAFEESGKALSSLILLLTVEVPDAHPGRRHLPEPPPAGTPSPPAGKSVRLGTGAAWARDRFEPALDLVERGDLDYLCFDSMSEVTMSAAQVARLENPALVAFDPYLDARLRPLLRPCKERGVRIVTNQGWLDPDGAARRLLQLAQEEGLDDLKVAAVSTGFSTADALRMNPKFLETGEPVADVADRIISAEVYLGAEGIVEALKRGADVVITGRIADGCLYLGPLAHEFGWDFSDHDAIAKGMVVGHLLECGTQVTGGFFADPGYKDVPDLAHVGHPICEVSEDAIRLTKLPGTGGIVSEATCKEQLLYEVQDPANYLCPDVTVDFTKVSFAQIAPDVVEVQADHTGAPPPPTLKALIGIQEGYMTEEMVLFAGPGARARAELTKSLLRQRFEQIALKADELRMDYVGLNSVHRESSPMPEDIGHEIVLRIALKCRERSEAEKLRREIDPLAVNGASGTGKWATSAPGSRIRAVVGLSSALVPRSEISTRLNLWSLTSVAIPQQQPAPQ